MENKKRLVNLDLLQVVAMVMIVCLHYLGKGGILESATLNDSNYYIAWFAENLSIIGVNCFIMCSGYLVTENRFRFSKMIYLWLQIIFFNIVLLILALVTGMYKFTAGTVFNIFLPISFVEYWYVSAYFIFYMALPLLLWITDRLSLDQLKKVTIALIIVFTVNPFQWNQIGKGYDFFWFIVLFFVATYIRKAELMNKSPKVYFGLYLLTSLVMLACKIVLEILSKNYDLFKQIDVRNYNFFLTFMSSVFMFAAFKNIKIKKPKIAGMTTFISSLTLGIYLIHENIFIRDSYWKTAIAPLMFFDKPYFVLHMIVCVLAVFFICAFLEYFRQLLFKLFNIPSLCDKLGEKLQNLTDKLFNSNIIEKL